MQQVCDGEWFVSDDTNRYGIRLYLSDNTVLEVVDVDCALNSIPQLLDRLQGDYIDAEQLRYIDG